MADPIFAPANPSANPDLRQWLERRIDGNSMRKLKLEREALALSLKATGLAQPATIINFNPVPLAVDGGLANFKVPSIIDKSVRDTDRIRVKYKGRDYRGTILTIREPRLYPKITDVKKVEDFEVGEYTMKACKQIEIAHGFLTSYTTGTESSSQMGGVVIFQGDKHVLGWDDEEKTYRGNFAKLEIMVPEYILLPTKEREYFCRPTSFMDLVAGTLDMQKAYSQIQTQTAQTCWDNEEMRMNITDVHRIWHQYELEMGWRQKAAPWITMEHENAETCPGCGTSKKRVDAIFCQCGRPYDPLKAYLAGEIPVDSPHMTRVPDGEWSKVVAEEERRRKRREAFAPPAEDKPKKGN